MWGIFQCNGEWGVTIVYTMTGVSNCVGTEGPEKLAVSVTTTPVLNYTDDVPNSPGTREVFRDNKVVGPFAVASCHPLFGLRVGS